MGRKERAIFAARVLTLALPVFAAPGTAHAQDQPAAGSDGVEDIVVTASKRSENLSKVGSAVVAVGGDALAEKGVTDVRSLDSAVTGVSFNANGTVVNASIRGIGSTQYSPLGGPAVGLNLDGVPVEGSLAANAMFYDINRVEVLKGPQGTLYGKNATAGVINIVSKRPQIGELGGSLSGEYGKFDAYRLDGAINLPVGDSAAARAAAVRVRRDGYFSNGYSDADDYGVRGQFLFHPADRWSVLFAADYFHQGGRGPTDVPLPLGSRNTDADNPWKQHYQPDPSDARLNNDYWGAHAEITGKIGGADLIIIPSYRELHRREIEYQFSFRGQVDDTDKQRSLEARLSGEVGPVRWLVGGYGFHGRRQFNGDFYNVYPTGYLNFLGFCDPAGTQTNLETFLGNRCVLHNGIRVTSIQSSLAGFGQVTYSLSNRTRVNVGLRYSSDKRRSDPNINYLDPALLLVIVNQPTITLPSRFFIPTDQDIKDGKVIVTSVDRTRASFSNLSFKLGVEHDLSPDTMLYANVATGYKAGGVNDVTASIYKPERITSYEAGIRTKLLDNKLRLHFTGFYWDYKNHQEGSIFAQPNGAIGWQVDTIPHGKLYGADLEADWRPTRADRLSLEASWLESDTGALSLYNGGYASSGHAYVNAPRWTVNLSYEHDFQIGGFVLTPQASTHVVSSYYTHITFAPDTRQGGYSKTDLTLTLKPEQGVWYIGGFVRNIENRTVIVNSQLQTGSSSYWGSLADPRTYGVRAGISF
jgi:iron complex outermembrane receptor protein